ncbi:MAG TPA: hypothetical protein RMF84_08185, partial [Polyangiaceae bacterium LLY-WYZ-14_1]|nr:hypothetical protein [Polyangiaceae bacterium LLY-WYZ-14_1]
PRIGGEVDVELPEEASTGAIAQPADLVLTGPTLRPRVTPGPRKTRTLALVGALGLLGGLVGVLVWRGLGDGAAAPTRQDARSEPEPSGGASSPAARANQAVPADPGDPAAAVRSAVPARTQVSLVTVPPGATVRLDDGPDLGTTPLVLALPTEPAREHVLHFSLSGFADVDRPLVLAGSPIQVEARLDPTGDPTPRGAASTGRGDAAGTRPPPTSGVRAAPEPPEDIAARVRRRLAMDDEARPREADPAPSGRSADGDGEASPSSRARGASDRDEASEEPAPGRRGYKDDPY